MNYGSRARLGDAQQIIFHEPGISVLSLEAQGEFVKARIAIAPDCRLGMHGLRIRTATGITNLHTFSVGALPEVAEVEPNDDFAQPQKIGLDMTVSGVVKNEDVDYFAIEAKKGERITAEIEGLRLGYTLFDPYVAIYNTGRFELGRADDSALLKQDGVVSLIAPEDGVYVIQVRESSYDGNDASTYRLHVGRFPRPTAVVPSGGRPGETLSVRWLGDLSGERVESITLPAAHVADFHLMPRDEHGVAPSGLPFRLVDFGNVIEAEPNNDPASANPCDTLPIACNGVIAAAGDVDFFKFHATKGQQLDVRVHARSLGSPLDAVLDIFKAAGGHISGNDDTGGPDSQMRFTAPEDGDYVVSIRDHLHQGGADYAYRIELTPPTPAVTLGLQERAQYVDTTISVPQNGRAAVMVTAKRADFGGDLRFEVKDLPGGVSAETVEMANNRNEVPLVLSAAEGAGLNAGLIDIVGIRREGDSPPAASDFIQRTMLVRGQNNSDMWGYVARRATLAVTQAAPFKIDIIEPKAPLVQGGSMNLKIVATRQNGFTAPINLHMLYNPPGIGSGGVTIGEGQTEALVPLTAGGGSELKIWPVAVTADATVGDGPVLVSSQLAKLEVAAPYLAFEPQATSVEQGKNVDMAIKIEKKKDFDGPAKVELLGAPNEVVADPREITKDTAELAFAIKTTDKSPVGRHKTLICRCTIMVNGEPVTHALPAGELRIDAPLPAVAAGAPRPRRQTRRPRPPALPPPKND